jgi:ribosomal protein S18
VRNVFNQYDQTENRVTHALLTVLNEDGVLLSRFLKELVRILPRDHTGFMPEPPPAPRKWQMAASRCREHSPREASSVVGF